MATTTPNFGWPVPTSTDLVKDGATAIEALGDGVDASLVDLKGGLTGQVLAKTTNTDLDFTWVTTDDTNAIQNAIVDAKGDLIAASAADTPARLAVGSNGETLVADSSATTGLRYQANFSAGKNKMINGDFNIWQRGTSFSYTGSGATIYASDRFAQFVNGDGTYTFSQQTFTPGAAPVAGYEGSFFSRFAVNTVGTSTVAIVNNQKIEDVRTFAGQTATYSFWAKVNSGTPTLTLKISQNFGSGGSATVTTTDVTVTLSSTWTRYSGTFALPSISGKTIGTSSFLDVQVRITPVASLTLDMWGVQLEAGSVATAFQTATGTLQGELAACQRYYWRFSTTASTAYGWFATGISKTATTAGIWLTNPVPMRTGATSLDFANLMITDLVDYNLAVSAATLSNANLQGSEILITNATGASAYRPAILRANNSSAAYIGCSAEL
jgi:hypothetical protein